MRRLYVDRATMIDFLDRLKSAFGRQGKLYLVGESILVYEGWSDRSRCLEFTAEIDPDDREAFIQIVNRLSEEMDVTVIEESPADVIPLPKGFRERARPAPGDVDGPLTIGYFDPYSVAFRLVTRGDEPDYFTVLAFLGHGWISVEEMNSLLSGLLPQFNKESIAQDPAEFRRKYRGLLQMWREMGKRGQGMGRKKLVK